MMFDTTPYTAIDAQYGRLVTYSLPCPNITPRAFTAHAQGQPRYYWENARESVALAGMGTALEITAFGMNRFQMIHQRAHELFDTAAVLNAQHPILPRLFGGFSFRDDFVPDQAWADFTPAHFVLPHYQLVCMHDETWLTINVHIPFDDDPHALRDDLHNALIARIQALQAEPPPSKPSAVTSIDYPLTYDQWHQMITSVTQRMKRSEFEKVVLSRVAEAHLSGNIHLQSVLDYLNAHYAGCYRFLFEPRPHHAFYGATPELITGVQGNQLKTMALAGSIQRGDTPQADADYAQQLLNSSKDRHEHDIVVKRLRERLLPMTTDLHIAETTIYRLSNIQHLYTPITGTLRQAEGVLNVLQGLHPTPALGGEPRDVALQVISESEPVPRGWYAAPVGWIDSNLDGQFVVAIRSAVAQKHRVWMYSGAGIVADSDPLKEWQETALKFRPIMGALGIDTDMTGLLEQLHGES